jgi:hypothetical protein
VEEREGCDPFQVKPEWIWNGYDEIQAIQAIQGEDDFASWCLIYPGDGEYYTPKLVIPVS